MASFVVPHRFFPGVSLSSCSQRADKVISLAFDRAPKASWIGVGGNSRDDQNSC